MSFIPGLEGTLPFHSCRPDALRRTDVRLGQRCARLGADVVKIELPGLDSSDMGGPPRRHGRISITCHRNNAAHASNLKDPRAASQSSEEWSQTAYVGSRSTAV